MLLRSTYVDYVERDELLVRVCGRGADGSRVVRYIEGTRPHFYAPANADVAQAVSAAADGDGEYDPVVFTTKVNTDGERYAMYDGRPLQRVDVETPHDVGKLVETGVFDYHGESDIPYYRRATLDYDLSGYIRVPDYGGRCHISEVETDISPSDVDPITPRILIADIEVEVTPGQTFNEMQEAVDSEVLAITFYDTHAEDYFLGIVDPEGKAEGSAIRDHLEAHWDGHDLAPDYTEADITLARFDLESELLARFIGEVRDRDPDLLSGWNWVGFDHQYLLDRIEMLSTAYGIPDPSALSTLGITQRWKDERAIEGLPGFDQMDAYTEKMSFHEWRSKALDYVATEELGLGKVDHPGIMDDYEHNRSRLAAYNLLDVQLCAALSDQLGIEEFFYDLADMSGIQITDTFSELRLVDGYMLSRRGPDEVLPSMEEKPITRPAGGLVLSPSDGIQDWAAAFDFKSLYPSAMVTGNISAETMVDDPVEADIIIPAMPAKEADVGGRITADDISWDMADGALGFTLDTEGIQPKYTRRMFTEREARKALRNDHPMGSLEYRVYDRQQASVKVIMNSSYGVSNSKYYRLAKDGVGDAITALGRYTLWVASEVCRALGYEVIYGDTDSVFIQLADPTEDVDLDDILARGRRLTAELNARMERVAEDIGIPASGHPYLKGRDLHGTAHHCLVAEFEKVYDRFFQAGSKKRYAGHLVWKEGQAADKLDVTGFESQRADVPEVTAQVQNDVIERVLAGDEFGTISEYVRGVIADVTDGVIPPSEVGVPMSLNKGLDGYGNLPRARAARFSNAHLGADFGPGDTPWVFYVERTPIGVPDTDVIAVAWHDAPPDGYPVDQDTTVQKAFESALTPILNEAGWTYHEVQSGRRSKAVGSDDMMEYDGDPFATSTTTRSSTDDSTTSDDGGWGW